MKYKELLKTEKQRINKKDKIVETNDVATDLKFDLLSPNQTLKAHQLNESIKSYNHIKDVDNIIGLDDDLKPFYQEYVNSLDPYDKRDAKIIKKIRSGN